jgi:arsenate reductase-like glutaredoxin family protein
VPEKDETMDYLLFTYPNCEKCDKLKKLLAARDVYFQEYSLTQPEGKARIILPTLILNDQGIVRAVLNSAEELEGWSRSGA